MPYRRMQEIWVRVAGHVDPCRRAKCEEPANYVMTTTPGVQKPHSQPGWQTYYCDQHAAAACAKYGLPWPGATSKLRYPSSTSGTKRRGMIRT